MWFWSALCSTMPVYSFFASSYVVLCIFLAPRAVGGVLCVRGPHELITNSIGAQRMASAIASEFPDLRYITRSQHLRWGPERLDCSYLSACRTSALQKLLLLYNYAEPYQELQGSQP